MQPLAAVAKSILANTELYDVESEVMGDNGLPVMDRVAAFVYISEDKDAKGAVTFVQEKAPWVTPGLLTTMDYMICEC